MTLSVNTVQRGQVSVTLNQTSSGLLQPSSGRGVSINSQLTRATVGDLLDVTGTPANGYTLVWDTDLNKYIVRTLTVSDLNLDVDGGTF